MPDGVNIDWGLLKQPDYVGDYANAFQLGRGLAQPTPSVPPSVNAFAMGAPAAPAAPIPPREMAAHIAGLDGPGRARAAEQADLLASLGAGLRAYPYAQRPGIVAHLAPALIARGAPPQALASFDPTDEALDGIVSQARLIGQGLAGAS